MGERSGRGREALVGPELDFLSLRDIGGVLERREPSDPVEELEVDEATVAKPVEPLGGDVELETAMGTLERDACERLTASVADPGRTGTNCR